MQRLAVLGAHHNARTSVCSRTNAGGRNGKPCNHNTSIYIYICIKVKVTPWHAYAWAEGRRKYSSKPIRSPHWKVVAGQHNAPASLLPGKARHLLCRRLGGPRGSVWTARKISPPTGIQIPGRSSPLRACYTDWTIPATVYIHTYIHTHTYIRTYTYIYTYIHI
jgi:hypothetical protein